MFTRTRGRLAGPPFALPEPLDRAAEAWRRALPRTRFILVAGGVSLLLVAGAARAAAPGQPPVTVWVATRDVLPGETLTDADLRRRSWPEDLAPPAVAHDPAGTVTALLPHGAVVTDGHLADLGVVASVPRGRVAVAVPAEQLPVLVPGTGVDLVGPGVDGSGVRLAAGATVIAGDEATVWVAVDPHASLAVSAAVATATITAVVLPSTSDPPTG